MAKLPKDIEQHLQKNFTFNTFGIVNIGALRASVNTNMSTAELKQAINERFAKEMVGGAIEYIGKEK
jgi:hypothetical protein